MKDLKFRNWLITERWKDIFGFDNENVSAKRPKSHFHTPVNEELPIHSLDIERITDRLATADVRGKGANLNFVNEVIWGQGEGSIKVKIEPDLHTTISRLHHDLTGVPTWVTKKNFVLNREGYGGNEEFIVQELLTQIKGVDTQPNDTPKNDYNGLEKLVVAMTNKIRRVGREIFVFEGIKKLDENKYVIRFSVQGQGVEAPDHRRIVENQTILYYDPKTGKIRLTNKNIETNIGGHAWEIMPSDTDVNFFPSQPRDEIIEVMATTMRWY